MRRPPLALALAVVATSAAGALAAGAVAQDVPPFQPEPTTTAPTTTTEPAPAPDASGPVIAVQLPKTRTGSKIKSLRITFREPDSSIAYAQVDVKRRIRLSTGVKDQSYDGKASWFTTRKTSAKYRLYPKVQGTVSSYTLKFRKGLPAARYWITVKAQNDPGTSRTKTVSFRTR